MENNSAGEVLGKCSREKDWDELNVNERVERIRKIVKDMKHAINRLNEEVDLLKQHSHDCEDKLVIPFDARNRTPDFAPYYDQSF